LCVFDIPSFLDFWQRFNHLAASIVSFAAMVSGFWPLWQLCLREASVGCPNGWQC